MSILDQALNLYIDKKISEAPTRKFNDAINSEISNFSNLCNKAGLQREENRIIHGVLLPFIEAVEKRLLGEKL